MNKIIGVLKNKYIITSVFLIVWVLFFDKNDLRTQIELKNQVTQLTEERNYYSREIKDITSDLKELNDNPKTLEKFAREKYLMKKDNEDIFVIVEEQKQTK